MIEGKSLDSEERSSKRRKRSELMKKFGINADQYDTILKEQKYVCAICNKPDLLNRGLAVDHCHKTNKVRGLLCTNCNMGLGKFQDNVEYIQNALTYLQRDYEIPAVNDTIINISHDDRPNWKMLVTTPDGQFPSTSHAAKHYKVHETTMRNWCLEGGKLKKEGFSFKKLYISMNELKDYIKWQR
jgi:Recombination endonuclease VII